MSSGLELSGNESVLVTQRVTQTTMKKQKCQERLITQTTVEV